MISEKAKKLGEALVASQILTRKQIDGALSHASQTNSSSLIIALLEADFLTFTVFEKFLAASLGIKSFIIGERVVPPKTLNILSKATIEKKFIFPLETKVVGPKKYLILGMVDPLDTDAITLAKSESGCNITNCLISLPDFKRSVTRHFTAETSNDVDLGIAKLDDNMVLIRPGGYEEEIEFQKQTETHLKNTKTKIPVKPREINLETNYTSSRTAEHAQINPYLGSNEPRFKEEVLAKLELEGSDAKRFRHEKYRRESLFKELQEVSLKPLVKVFESLSEDLKMEAIFNALIEKGLLTKRDVYHSAAISYIFRDNKT